MKAILVNNTALKNRLLVFNHKIIIHKTATDARTLIENIDIKELFAACPGAVTYFCWVKLNLLMYFQGYKIISVENATLTHK